MLAWGIAPGIEIDMATSAESAFLTPRNVLGSRQTRAGSELRFQRWRFFAGMKPGALPQAHADCCAFGAKDRDKKKTLPYFLSCLIQPRLN